jgi:hypothetical protein
MAGSLLGALLVRRLDIVREDAKLKRQIVGAINTVLAEIAANDARLTTQVENKQTLVEDLALSSTAYRRVELILAEHLDDVARSKLFEAYAPIEGGDLWVTVATMTSAGTGVTTARQGLDLKRCAEAIKLMDVAGAALREARERLGGH